jgi:hypothetical protein
MRETVKIREKQNSDFEIPRWQVRANNDRHLFSPVYRAFPQGR